MTLLQHIVASDASLKMQHRGAYRIFPQRHNGAMPDSDSNGGPNYLRAWREAAGLSQEELAKAAETTHQVIGYLERGRTQLSAKWLRKLAPILETTPGRLLDFHPDDVKGEIATLYDYASPVQRRQIADIARTITRTGTDD